MPLIRLALAALLFLPAAPAAAQSAERRLADEFLAAHRAQDRERQTILAARPPLDVAYAVVVHHLLMRGETAAAKALATARTGPEREGLARLLTTFHAGHRPTADQLRLLQEAEILLGRNEVRAALAKAKAAGEPVEGTILGVHITNIRARALMGMKSAGSAADELGRCARLARAVGWWTRARDAEWRRARLAPKLVQRVAAADRYVEACEKLNDDVRLLDAYPLRAKLRLAYSQTRKKRDEMIQQREKVRIDYLAAIDVAQRLGRRKREAQLQRILAFVWHFHDGRPQRSLKHYRRSLEILRGLDEPKELQEVLLNTSIALTEAGRYDEAQPHLDELLAVEALDAEVRPRALAQNAVVLARRGLVEAAIAAYGKAIAAVTDETSVRQLQVDVAELHYTRSDLREALRLVDVVLAKAPDHRGARRTRARVRGTLGDEKGAREDFKAVLASNPGPAERARTLLLKAGQERSWGKIGEAILSARAAIQVYKENPHVRDLGNAGTAWLILADLFLLRHEYQDAQKWLANAGTIFFRLNQPQFAIDPYIQETLLLVSLKRMDDAVKRLAVLMKMAETTPSDALKSAARSAEGIFEARAAQGEPTESAREKRMRGALARLVEAERLAKKAGDPLRHATALVNRALLEPARALELVQRAHAILDARRTIGPEEHPLIEGHRPEYAGSVALQALVARPEAPVADAFALLERVRAERLVVALRGREALLAAVLPEELHGAYVAARGGLLDARAKGAGVEAAERAYDAMVERLRRDAPAAAALAFPRPPALADVQRALRADETLLLMLDDTYGRVMIAIEKKRAILGRFDGKKPLAGVAELLRGKRHVIVAPDGRWAAQPLETAPWGKGLAFDAFRFYYVASAASFLRQRTSKHGAPGEGVAALGRAPARFGEPLTRLPARRVAYLHLGVPAQLMLDHPQAARFDTHSLAMLSRRYRADTVVVPETSLRRTAHARAEGVAAPVEASIFGGASNVIVSLAGAPPAALLDRFYANCLDKGMTAAAALNEAKSWARGRPELEKPTAWASLVLFGVP